MKKAKIYLELIKRTGFGDAYFVTRVVNCIKPSPGDILSESQTRDYIQMENVEVVIDRLGRKEEVKSLEEQLKRRKHE